jgi:hypothetical protein
LEATVQGQSCTMPETPTSRKNEIAAKKAMFWGRKMRKPHVQGSRLLRLLSGYSHVHTQNF